MMNVFPKKKSLARFTIASAGPSDMRTSNIGEPTRLIGADLLIGYGIPSSCLSELAAAKTSRVLPVIKNWLWS